MRKCSILASQEIDWATKTRLHALPGLRVSRSTTKARYAECQKVKLTWYVVRASSSIQVASLVLRRLQSRACRACLRKRVHEKSQELFSSQGHVSTDNPLYGTCTTSFQVIEATCNHAASVFCLQLSGKFKPSCFNEFLPHRQVSETINLRRGQAISAMHITLSQSHLCWQLPMSESAHFPLDWVLRVNWPFQIPS